MKAMPEKVKRVDSTERPNWRNEIIATGVPTAVLLAAGVIANRTGANIQDFIDASSLTLNPPVIPGAVDGMISTNNTMRDIAPFTTAGLVAFWLRGSIKGRLNRKQAQINKLATQDYSGQGNLIDSDKKSMRDRARGFVAGATLTTVAVGLTGAFSALDNEISKGPVRPIQTVLDNISDQVPGSKDQAVFVLQGENNTLMDDSVISPKEAESIYIEGVKVGVTAIPFSKSLFTIDGESSMQFAVPDDVFEKMTDKKMGESCDVIPVVVDSTVGAKVGDSVDINGTNAQVVEVKEGIAQMNRSIAILPETGMRECIKGGADSSYFGLIIPDADEGQVNDILDKTETNDLAAISEDKFKANNEMFWSKNGTTLVFLLMGSLAVFGGIAVAGQRKSMLEHNKREIGTLLASGAGIDNIRSVEMRRTLRDSLKAGLIAAPLTPLVTAAFNASVSGFSASAGPRETMVGFTMMTAASLIGTKFAVDGLQKDLYKNDNLATVVKG